MIKGVHRHGAHFAWMTDGVFGTERIKIRMFLERQLFTKFMCVLNIRLLVRIRNGYTNIYPS